MIEHGLARERTRLSWRRTTLSAGIAAILLEIQLITDASPVVAALGGLVIATGWFGLVMLAYRRIRTLDRGLNPTLTRSPALVTLLVGGYALLGLIFVIVIR
jgi:uncharacterized membrane protein YidH (DUF202 family)